jgi:hypothetical protein
MTVRQTLIRLGVVAVLVGLVVMSFYTRDRGWRKYTPGPPTTYHDSYHGFAIDYPSDWVVEPQTATVFSIKSPRGIPGRAGRGSVDIYAHDMSGFTPRFLDEDTMVDMLRQQHQGFALLESGMVNVNGLDAFRVVFQARDLSTYQALQYRFHTDREMIWVRAEAKPSEFDKYRDEFEQICRSFRRE